MKNIWTVLCQKSIIDKTTNNVSLIEAIDQLNVSIADEAMKSAKREGKDFVFINANLELVTLWYDEKISRARDFDYKVNIVSSDKKEIGSLSGMINFPKETKRIRSQLLLEGLPISKSDIYSFEMFYKERGSEEFIKAGVLPIDIFVNA
jgi:hypothetical protein